jgi:hypothetical protein
MNDFPVYGVKLRASRFSPDHRACSTIGCAPNASRLFAALFTEKTKSEQGI